MNPGLDSHPARVLYCGLRGARPRYLEVVGALAPATSAFPSRDPAERGPAPLEYEKGSPAWDIGMIFTRHASKAHGDKVDCARVLELRDSVGSRMSPQERLDRATVTDCTCGAGNSPTELTTERAKCLPLRHVKTPSQGPVLARPVS